MAVEVNPGTGASGNFGWDDGAGQIDSIQGDPNHISWTITLTGDGTIDFSAWDPPGTVQGDNFSLLIDGQPVAWTSVTYPDGYFVGSLNDHLLTEGTHTITLIVGAGSYSEGGSYYSISAVTYLNQDPVANVDLFTVPEDGTSDLDVLGNDTDADEDPLTIDSAVITDGLGMVSIVNGQIRYDPGQDYQYLQVGENETVSVDYSVSDGNGGTDTAVATITIEGVNDGPTAVDDSVDVVEDQSVAGNVVTNDTDPEDDTLTITNVSFGDHSVAAGNSIQGTYGTLTLNADGTYTYAADADYLDTLTDATGLTETFEYVVTDGSITSTATLAVNVSLADDARTTYGNAGRANVIYGDQNGLIGAEDTIYGGEKVDRLYGLDGADVLDGGRAPDELYGGNGIDRLLGGDGNDKLDGGAGNDVLVGGANDDRLTGGEGEDIFVFGWTQKDTVTDFTQGEDKIQLDGVTIQSQTFGDYDRDGVTDLRLVTDGGMITLLGVSNPLTPDDFF